MQFLSYLIAIGSIIPASLAVATCPTPTTCKGVSGIVATAIKSYAPAQTTVATSTVTSTVATTTVTAQAAPSTTTPIVTSTETNTITENTTPTVTSTVTVRVNAQPAALAARAVDPSSSQLSSLIKSQASSFVGAVCTCIETPASTTVTTTPTSVTSITATSTSSVTASSTTTVTPTSSTTVTVTAEPTTTITTTTTTTTSTKECTNGCLCDSIAVGTEGGRAYCYRPPFEQNPGTCVRSSDCPPDSFCDTDISLCQGAQGCDSTFTPAAAAAAKRFARSVEGRRVYESAVPEVNPAKFGHVRQGDSE
ncbi:hypothetical protein Q7P35_004002 [Cladosporium inversicolor]